MRIVCGPGLDSGARSQPAQHMKHGAWLQMVRPRAAWRHLRPCCTVLTVIVRGLHGREAAAGYGRVRPIRSVAHAIHLRRALSNWLAIYAAGLKQGRAPWGVLCSGLCQFISPQVEAREIWLYLSGKDCTGLAHWRGG
jgi:hypothetical protein